MAKVYGSSHMVTHDLLASMHDPSVYTEICEKELVNNIAKEMLIDRNFVQKTVNRYPVCIGSSVRETTMRAVVMKPDEYNELLFYKEQYFNLLKKKIFTN